MKAFRLPLLLATVAVLLAGIYFVLDQNADPTETGQLYRFAAGEGLREVTLTNHYGSFTFDKENGNWVITSPARYRVNKEKVTLMELALLDVPVNRVLESEAKEYGLAQPVATVSFLTSKNARHSFYVGNRTPSQAQAYLKDVESGRIIVADIGAVSQFDGSLNAYRDKEVFSIDKSKISKITYYKDGQKQIAVEQVDAHAWQMTYPYRAPARRVEVSQLLAKMQNWTTVGYPEGDLNLTALGLDKPGQALEVTDAAGNSQRLEFGSVADGVVNVRTGSVQDITQLFAVDVDLSVLSPDKLLFVAPLQTTIGQVSRLQVAYPEMQATIQVDNSQDPARITSSGQELAYAEFISFFVRYISLSAEGRDTGREAGEPYMSLTTTFSDGHTATLRLFDRDADTLFMDVDGKAEFFTSRESVAQLVYFLKTALASRK